MVTQIETLKKYAESELEIDWAETGELVLSCGSEYLSQAILRIATSDDKKALWERFEKSLIRIYGVEWSNWKSLDDPRPLICKESGCTELALNGICDQCLA